MIAQRIKAKLGKLAFTLYLLGIYFSVALGAVGLVTGKGQLVLAAFVSMVILFALIMYPYRGTKHGH